MPPESASAHHQIQGSLPSGLFPDGLDLIDALCFRRGIPSVLGEAAALLGGCLPADRGPLRRAAAGKTEALAREHGTGRKIDKEADLVPFSPRQCRRRSSGCGRLFSPPDHLIAALGRVLPQHDADAQTSRLHIRVSADGHLRNAGHIGGLRKNGRIAEEHALPGQETAVIAGHVDQRGANLKITGSEAGVDDLRIKTVAFLLCSVQGKAEFTLDQAFTNFFHGHTLLAVIV